MYGQFQLLVELADTLLVVLSTSVFFAIYIADHFKVWNRLADGATTTIETRLWRIGPALIAAVILVWLVLLPNLTELVFLP